MSYRIPPNDRDLLADCDVQTFRSGGPGGQHANKVESAVRLIHRPTGESVTRRDTRSQHRNKQLAVEELRRRLEAMARPAKRRVASAPTAASRRRRLERKRQQGEKKRLRQPPED
jgi:ribosome-associated protein